MVKERGKDAGKGRKGGIKEEGGGERLREKGLSVAGNRGRALISN